MLSEAAAVSANAAMGALVVSALAGLVGVRIVIGFLLAIGPLLIACLLFEGSRGLFMGWLRALVGTLIAAIAVPAVLALQNGRLDLLVYRLRQEHLDMEKLWSQVRQALALVTHSAQDAAFSTSGTGGPVRNWGGRLGAWLADASYFLFGFSAWWCLAAGLRAWVSALAGWMRAEGDDARPAPAATSIEPLGPPPAGEAPGVVGEFSEVALWGVGVP